MHQNALLVLLILVSVIFHTSLEYLLKGTYQGSGVLISLIGVYVKFRCDGEEFQGRWKWV